MKTSELTGPALDWAVELIDGWQWCHDYSTNWGHGGPIIEREQLSVVREYYNSDDWTAYMPSHIRDESAAFGYGPTPLIAAMRCYVESKLGDEVEIPEELT